MPDTAIELDFGPGTFRFWLPIPQVIELERNCGSQRVGDTPAVPKSMLLIYDQLGAGLAADDGRPVYLGGGGAILKDIRETIRLGLIGGNSGMVDGEQVEVGPIRGKELVDEYVYPARPLVESVYLAWSILHAAINGISLKKKVTTVQDHPVEKRSPSTKAQ
ncbi:MAG: hypothetical protein ABFC96_07620 [Thermoguttaceae bacterium]